MQPIILLSLVMLSVPDLTTNDNKPNIVVIITDDQGWADIGYNNARVYTPNIDKLARAGTIFERHYVMPQCTPTRIAFFTGRYPSRFGPPGLAATNEKVFPTGTFNVARLLKNAGYQTAIIGKWHMGSRTEFGPNHHGFDYSYGSLTGAVGSYDHRYRKGQFEVTWHRNHDFFSNHQNGAHVTDLVAKEAVKFIHKKRSKPFFLYLPFHAPHTPLDERGDFVDTPTQLDPDKPDRWKHEDEIKWFHDSEGKIQAETDPEKRLFLAVLHHLDDAIGRVVTALDESEQLENTLILFSSDNGPQVNWGGNAYPNDLKLTNFNQPDTLKGKKCDVWEGGIHVPGFAHWPRKITPGRQIKQPVHIVDWLPTLANVSGQNQPQDTELDGMDLSNLLFTNKPLPARTFYWVWNNKTNRWALRQGNWKIVKYGKGEPEVTQWQLFNLIEDPGEQHNLATVRPKIVNRLHEIFKLQRGNDKLN